MNLQMRTILLSFILFYVNSKFVVSQETVIQDVNVMTMTQEEVLMHQDVWVKDGVIHDIVKSGAIPVGEETQVIQGSGKYLLPGLSEMHAHIPVPSDGDETLVKETMMLYLSKGITVIRGMLGNPYHLEFREKANSGEIVSPRVYTSSPSMNGNSITTPEEARTKVQQAHADGYDFLKIHPGVQLEVMQSLVRTANEVGIPFSGHVPADVGIEKALQYKYASVDHADGYIEGLVADNADVDRSQGGFFGSGLVDHLDWSKMDYLAQLTLDQEVWLVPTQSLFTRWVSPVPAEEMMKAKEMSYLPASTRYAWLSNKSRMLSDPGYSADNFKRFLDARNKILLVLHQKGVNFLLGSDSPQVMNVPGFSIHHEISSLVDAGIPVIDIIRSGTVNVARFFGQEGQFGTIEKGASADLILVTKDPQTDYKTLANPEGVMIFGKYLTREYLDDQMKMIAERNSE